MDKQDRTDRRGFGSMDATKQRAIAAKGGRAAHEKGTGHEWTSKTAAIAGRLGGIASRGGRGKRVVQPEAAAS